MQIGLTRISASFDYRSHSNISFIRLSASLADRPHSIGQKQTLFSGRCYLVPYTKRVQYDWHADKVACKTG